MALEVCVDSVTSALSAMRGGARRLELCSALALGGLTPSLGMFQRVKQMLPRLPIFVMIRPKPGEDYTYNDHEILVMLQDIQIFKENKADGFVFGCLTSSRQIDEEACVRLLRAAEGLPCTFHRAFDMVQDPEVALSTLTTLGFKRVLTSGKEKNAYLGRNIIRKLVSKVEEMGSDLMIVAGGGIDPDNLKQILETGVKEYHGSASAKLFRSSNVYVTDEFVVKEMVKIAEMASKSTNFPL